MGPSFRQQETSSRQARLARAIRKYWRGLFSELQVDLRSQRQSPSQPPYQHSCNCISKIVFVYTVVYELERAETIILVFLAPYVLTDENPYV